MIPIISTDQIQQRNHQSNQQTKAAIRKAWTAHLKLMLSKLVNYH
jgi:hypothetical protein